MRQAKQALPEIRRIMAEGHEKVRKIAALALAKIEKEAPGQNDFGKD